jgi:hypothetical protein
MLGVRMARDKILPQSKKKKQKEAEKKENKMPLAVGRILIVCEGKKTEPNYFMWWANQLESIKHLANVKKCSAVIVNSLGDEIQVEGLGDNTKSLVTRAIDIKNKAIVDYQECWCVFDKDSFSADKYNEAIQLAENNDFKVAYTNEAFELWYLLHFNPENTARSRTQYKGILTKLLGKKYQKNDQNMYDVLIAKQQDAIRNARTLLATYNGKTDYSTQNPSTQVHELVESLNKNLGKFRCQVAPDYALPYVYECCDKYKSHPTKR